MATPSVRGASQKLLRGLRQHEAVTGTRLSPDQIRAIVEGELATEAGLSVSRAQIGLQRERQQMLRDQIEAQERAAEIRGGVELATLPIRFSQTSKALGIERLKAENIGKLAASFKGGGAAADIATGLGGAGELGGIEGLTAAAEGSLPGAGAAVAEVGAEAVATEAAGGLPIGAGLGALGIGAGISGLLEKEGASDVQQALGGAIVGGAAAGTAILPGIGTVGGAILGALGSLADDTVICTELHMQGHVDSETLHLAREYRLEHIDMVAYLGYRMWADTVVKWMRRNRGVSFIVKPLGIAWCQEMARRTDRSRATKRTHKWVGSLLLIVGLPMCRKIATVRCNWLARRVCHG